MNNRKIGKICISSDFLYSDNAPSFFAMLNFVPLHVECHHYLNSFYMIGISSHFADLPFGCEAPLYKVGINTDDDGNIDSLIVNSQ